MTKNVTVDVKNSNGFEMESEKTYFVSSSGKDYHFYLSSDIGEAESYVSWLQVMRSATQDDRVFFHINSPGGVIHTTMQILQAMDECQATIFGSVEGECCSAATMILLNCDNYMLSPYTYFMVHNFSGGTYGKGNEMQSKVEFEKRWFDNIAYSTYQGFMTPSEIKDMLRGVDFYFDAIETHERMEKRNLFLHPPKKEPRKRKVVQGIDKPTISSETVSTKDV